MPWDDNLLPGQREAASHSGTHARVLAGPGTGKTLTLTRHVCYLLEELHVPSAEVLVITFTRAAAAELRQRFEQRLGATERPAVLTLHSFALRQLLRNSDFVSDLPRPLRIADDWEERHIVQEDLKALLGLSRITQVQDLMHGLSADWQSLTADDEQWERRFPNPTFLGAWREHRSVYGYTLRDELAYQLKKMLEQRSDCEIAGPIR
ncbi:MAG: UvrD-helicase domain-containing protein, partial [Dehalococcoidia bacterium]|nr:UvrD-helicase domain-containing protein [Dehalococcoidia bacterium]